MGVSRLRERRLELGWGQAELGRRAGISRQAVNAIEREQTRANVDTALRIAQALDRSVEELFGSLGPGGPVWADSEIEPQPGMRVAVERWAGQAVARPLAAHPAWPVAAAHGEVRQVEGREVAVELWATRPALFIYGCDPALGLLAAHLSQTGGEGWWWNASNGQALSLLRGGQARAVALHHGVLEARAVDHSCLRLRLVGWQSGWLVARGNPLGIRSAADLLRPEIRIGVRESGAEARRLLEQELAAAAVPWAALAGRTIPVRSQLGAARLVADGLVDTAIGHAGAASALACDLVPIRGEVTDLLIPRAVAEQAEVRRLLACLVSAPFRRDLAASGPYDTGRTGEEVG